MPCVHSDDFEPMSIIQPDIKKGPWIAGGAPLRWFQGLPVSENDIDIFCRSPKQVQEVIDRIKSYGRYSTKYDSENAVTLRYHSKEDKYWTLQIVKRKFFNDMQEVIDNFDITVCQVGTDGHYWSLANNTAKDIRERNLRMNMPLHPDAAKRLLKYWTYGYRPVEGLIEAVQTNPIATKEFQNEEYGDAF